MNIVWRAVCVSLVLSAQVLADPPPSYYATATGLTGGALKQSLHGIVSGHTVIPYTSLNGPLAVIWRDPANSANLILSYSRTSVPVSSSWNREHLWPRSRGNTDQAGPDDSDLFHVVPTDVSVNAERASLYFDESDPGDPGYRIPAHALAPQTSRDSDSWQPPPQERGDIARALFYMDVRYDGQEPQTTDFDLVSFPPAGSQMARLNTLLLWNQQDPPDDAERARNDLIYTAYQHNRNPFIDHPEWAAEIWGQPTQTGGGTRPIARVGTLVSSAVESPASPASLSVSLNQFAGTGGIVVGFTMSGLATPGEYTLSGPGVTYDPATGAGSVLIAENFSSATLSLLPVADGVIEPAEAATLTLAASDGYIIVPDASAAATVTITDAPKLPASWTFDTGFPFTNPLLANTGAGSISFTGWLGTLNSFAGVSGNSLALVGAAGNGSWIEISLSMTGYTALTLSFWTRGTSSGFDSGTWSASVDGSTFIPVSGVNTATRNTIFAQRQVSFAGIPGLTDAANVTLRYTLNGASGTAANNRIDELVATATPIVTGDALRTVSVAAVDPTASEPTLDPGTFIVQLNGPAPAGGLDVAISFAAGTATPPGLPEADFSWSGLASFDPATRIGHVVFAAGQSAASVVVTPLADAIAEGAETVVAQLASSASYLLSPSNVAVVTILEPIANDNFGAAAVLSGTTINTTGTNVGATQEPGEPWHHESAQIGGRSVWWKWQAPADGVVEVTTAGSNFDTMLACYQGPTVSSLTRLGVNDDADNLLTSRLAVRVSAFGNYSFAVDGYGQSAGNIALALRFYPIPTVSIAVIQGVARERGNVPAVLRCTASHLTPLPLTLGLSVSGGAVFGTDFTLSSGSATALTLPANQLSVDLTITPITNTNPLQGTRTITVLLPNAIVYRPQPFPQNSVSVVLEDDTPYTSSWTSRFFGLTPAAASIFGDADADGTPGLLEFIADRDPRLPDGQPLLSIESRSFVDPADGVEKPFAALRVVRRQDAATIPLLIETRSSLLDGVWTPGAVLMSTTPIAGTAREELLYRSAQPLDASGNLSSGFYRLRAVWP